jgi:hypothetical protein
MSGDVTPDVAWWKSRYLSEHWGTTMAAQDRLAIEDYRARVRDRIRDLLAAETFGPKAVLTALDDIASQRGIETRRAAQVARENRHARLKANGGCPICADAETPNPDAHRDFHDRMTGAKAVPA